ncbi:hypothetical protein BGZ63DRAFT_426279 [Mariannaea sp. PMI_226]|nr:hypothetical protein BGZ63DRAFT_426279 [Mariannaea sp. PMI_226]
MDANVFSNDSPSKDGGSIRPACSECQRRKQKCNREWPCNHCQKRKVADKCHYGPDTDQTKAASSWTPSTEVKRKREAESDAAQDDWDATADLEAIGYTASHLLSNLKIESNGTAPEQYRMHVSESPHLQRALQILPARQYIDSLVQNFLEDVNYYYYIIYPSNFIKEYATWWRERDNDQPLGFQWTCLLIMVCACSVQHTNSELAARLRSDLGFTTKQLTNQYHDAARELHSAIPVGHSHIFSVQYLLHSCYWFKAEARFVECWQILGATVREAQALDLHKESTKRISEFEREMRRRLWCIVDSWDWLVSCLLARPMLVDRADSTVALPTLTIEDFPVSPLLHLKLQSELVGIIFKRFGPPRILTDHAEILEYQQILEDFMKTFPPAYGFENTDTRPEQQYPWIALHRHYMHTCTLSITLGPFRPFMAKQMSKATPPLELQFRRDGIDYALRLMNSVHAFFEWVWARDSTFHFVPFCIFDTAALLCSALLHDEDGTIPQRNRIVASVDLALSTLKRLRTATETAKKPYDVLRRLVQRVWKTLPDKTTDDQRKRPRRDDQDQFLPAIPSGSGAPYNPANNISVPAPSAEMYTNIPLPHPTMAVETCAGCASCTAVAQPVPVQAPEPPPLAVTSAGEAYVLPSTLAYEAFAPWPQANQPVLGPMPSNGVMNMPPPAHPSVVETMPLNGAINGNSPNDLSCIGPVSLERAVSWSAGEMGNMAMNIQQQHLRQQQEVVEDLQNVDGRILSEAELGDLADLWNWQSLDLGYDVNPIL